MNKLLLLLMMVGGGFMAGAAPLWMRYNTISPDGSKIAFAYKGDIYVVDRSGRGGTALNGMG